MKYRRVCVCVQTYITYILCMYMHTFVFMYLLFELTFYSFFKIMQLGENKKCLYESFSFLCLFIYYYLFIEQIHV